MKWRALECVLVVAIVLVLVRLFGLDSTGSVHYFSPDSLESKYRSDKRFLGLAPIYRSGLSDKSSALADYLMKHGYWIPTDSPAPRWIVTGHFSSSWKDGQSWLHRVLYWDEEKWIAWTEANPRLARLVWPHFLASLRRQKTEGEAIELLFLAEHAASVEQFRQFVQKSEVSDELKKTIANALE